MKSKKTLTLKSKKGQSSVEYILIIAAVVGVIFVFGGKFKSQIGNVTDKLFGNVNSGIDSLSK